jgi:hypothetical protein
MNEMQTEQAGWLQQETVVYGGMVAIGVVIMQAFIAAGAHDLAAVVSLVAFAVALPLLAVLIMLNQAQDVQHQYMRPWYLIGAKLVGTSGALLGVAAAFWHVLWPAGVVLAISGAVGLAVYAAGYQRLIGRGRSRR